MTIEVIELSLRTHSEEIRALEPGAVMSVVGKGTVSILTGTENLRRPTTLTVIDPETVVIEEVGRDGSKRQTLQGEEINNAHILLPYSPGKKAYGNVIYSSNTEQQETS